MQCVREYVCSVYAVCMQCVAAATARRGVAARSRGRSSQQGRPSSPAPAVPAGGCLASACDSSCPPTNQDSECVLGTGCALWWIGTRYQMADGATSVLLPSAPLPALPLQLVLVYCCAATTVYTAAGRQVGTAATATHCQPVSRPTRGSRVRVRVRVRLPVAEGGGGPRKPRLRSFPAVRPPFPARQGALGAQSLPRAQ